MLGSLEDPRSFLLQVFIGRHSSGLQKRVFWRRKKLFLDEEPCRPMNPPLPPSRLFFQTFAIRDWYFAHASRPTARRETCSSNYNGSLFAHLGVLMEGVLFLDEMTVVLLASALYYTRHLNRCSQQRLELCVLLFLLYSSSYYVASKYAWEILHWATRFLVQK